MLSRGFLLVGAVVLLLSVSNPAAGHEGGHDNLPEGAAEALSCRAAMAFAPDTERGEGTILVIIENRTDYQLRLKGPGIFKQMPPIDAGHCLKRFLAAGDYDINVTAFRLETYPWLKPLKEWFAIGGAALELTLPDKPVVSFAIGNENITFYSSTEYQKINLFQLASIAGIYFLTIASIAAFTASAILLFGKHQKKTSSATEE